MQNDLPHKLVEYKRQINELQMILQQKEREKEQFLANFEVGGGSTEYFSKALLERQSSELMAL